MDRYFADISNNNSQTVNWNQYRKAGHVLVGLKATEGNTFVDKTHPTRSENAHSAGVHVMHYHFAHPGKDANQQAQFFWAQIKGHFAKRDFAALDIEVSDGLSDVQVARWVEQFDAAFRHISGHTLIGYSGESFLQGLKRAGMKLAGERWWTAAYGPNEPHVAGTTTWAWQRTDGTIGPPPHTCAGIGNCDISSLNWATYLRLRLLKP